MNKKAVAREWLYLLGGLLFGLTVLPFLLAIVFGLLTHQDILASYSQNTPEFYSGLFGGRGGHDILFIRVVVFIPYLLFQAVRSVIWAWKTTRGPK